MFMTSPKRLQPNRGADTGLAFPEVVNQRLISLLQAAGGDLLAPAYKTILLCGENKIAGRDAD